VKLLQVHINPLDDNIYLTTLLAARQHWTNLSDLRPLHHSYGTMETFNVILSIAHWNLAMWKDYKAVLEKIEQIYSQNPAASTSEAAVATTKNFPDIEIGDFWKSWRLNPGAEERGEKRSKLHKIHIMLQEQLWESFWSWIMVKHTKWRNEGNGDWIRYETTLQQKSHSPENWRFSAVECTEPEEEWPWQDAFNSHLRKAHVVGHHAKAMNLGSRSSLVRPNNGINTDRGYDLSSNEYAVAMGKALEVVEHEATRKLNNETINRSTSHSGRLNAPIISYTNRIMVVQRIHGNCAAMPINTHEKQEHAQNAVMQSLPDDTKRPQPRPPMMSPDDDDDDGTIGFQREACSQSRMAPTTMHQQALHACEHPKCTKCHHQKCTNCPHRICTCCRSTLSRQNSGAEKHGFAAHELASKCSRRFSHGRWASQQPSIVHEWRAVIAQTCSQVAFATTIDRIDRPQTSIAVAG
jgi:hypothetical protein